MPDILKLMIEGGKATPNPQMAQSLGPRKINIQNVLTEINEKTENLKGMQIPVEIILEKDSNYKIKVGTPPTIQLIKKELGLEKGSGRPDKEKIANISIEQCIKVAKMKIDSMYTFDLKAAVKSVIGSCNSLGVLIEGKTSAEITEEIDAGKYDHEILEEKTTLSQEKKIILQKQFEEVRQILLKEAEKLKIEEEMAKGETKKVETLTVEKKEAAPEVKPEEKVKKEK